MKTNLLKITTILFSVAAIGAGPALARGPSGKNVSTVTVERSIGNTLTVQKGTDQYGEPDTTITNSVNSNSTTIENTGTAYGTGGVEIERSTGGSAYVDVDNEGDGDAQIASGRYNAKTNEHHNKNIVINQGEVLTIGSGKGTSDDFEYSTQSTTIYNNKDGTATVDFDKNGDEEQGDISR